VSGPLGGRAGIELTPLDAPLDVEHESFATGSDQEVARFSLAAGSYRGLLYGAAHVSAAGVGSVAGAVTMVGRARFTPFGGRRSAPSGKATKYVSIPDRASCPTGTLSPSVTGAKKATKKVKQVVFFVDGVKNATLKHPKPGQAVSLDLTTGAPSEVEAVVTLAPKHKGGKGKGKGKELTASAAYESCS
jgi:hypothetical protein